ncbi:MAG: DUF4199 domain-containing protein [Muribaculum sp.]|nr:DUF4199 domain-containing protein [Muribaculum sp.]
MDSDEIRLRSPYKRGADKGAVFGVYLSVLFLMTAYSLEYPGCSVGAFFMVLFVPVIIYISLRRSYVSDLGTTIFSSLWMEGIVIFFCGSLVSAVVAIVFMRWVEPDYIERTLHQIIEMYNSGIAGDQGKEVAEVLQAAIDQRRVPKAIELVIDMLWLEVFSGSILSMLMALLVQARGYKPKKV